MGMEEIIQILKTGESEVIEFKENVSRDIAAEICAFANTEGGTILIGVDDRGSIVGCKADAEQEISDRVQSVVPSPKIKISPISIDKKKLVVVKVERSDKFHSVGNVAYIRIGKNKRPLSIEEVAERAIENLKVRYDSMNSDAPASSISKEIVSVFLEKRKQRGLFVDKCMETNMKKLNIFVKGKPTNAGVLFFCKNPQEYIPNSGVRIAWFEDEEMQIEKDAKEFSGPLWKIVDDVEEYLTKNLKLIRGVFAGFKRTEIFEYPIKAIREIIINALIHRNYFIQADVRIFILPNKIIVKNPGSFPPGSTPENPEHIARNPLLCQYMHEWGYIEKYGIGIERVKKICSEHPLVSVQFNLKQYYTEVVFEKNKKLAEIDDSDQKILSLIKEGKNTSLLISKELEISKVSVVKRIKKLLVLSLIKQEGKGRATNYHPIR